MLQVGGRTLFSQESEMLTLYQRISGTRSSLAADTGPGLPHTRIFPVFSVLVHFCKSPYMIQKLSRVLVSWDLFLHLPWEFCPSPHFLPLLKCTLT